MIAGKPVNFGALSTVYQQSKSSPLSLPGPTITGTTSKSYSYTNDVSLQRNAFIFSNILRGGELPETFRESVTSTNLINLGKASLDISGALNSVAQGLQVQINQLKPNINQLMPQTVIPEESPGLPLTTSIKDKGLELSKNLSQIIGVSTATLGLIVVGIGGFLLLKKLK